MKKRYFFSGVFVKAAKTFAFFVLLAALGFCVLQYFETQNAVSAAAYQPSPSVQQALGKLKDVWSATHGIVSSFDQANQIPAPPQRKLEFPSQIVSSQDFVRVGAELSRIDQERQQLKQSIVSRFETLVLGIEEKLRSYAAGLRSSGVGAPASPTIETGASPVPIPSATPQKVEPGSLFSARLRPGDATERLTNLTQRKEFLEALGAKAESAANRAILGEAAKQLDLLKKLLPESEVSVVNEPGTFSTESGDSRTEPARKLFLSERVAKELQQLRGQIKQTLLTSWALDDALDQAAELTSVERDKCRVATLVQKGIWLSAASKVFLVLLMAIVFSFLILVCADLVKTVRDMGTDTQVMADSFRVLQGLARSTPQREPDQPSAVSRN